MYRPWEFEGLKSINNPTPNENSSRPFGVVYPGSSPSCKVPPKGAGDDWGPSHLGVTCAPGRCTMHQGVGFPLKVTFCSRCWCFCYVPFIDLNVLKESRNVNYPLPKDWIGKGELNSFKSILWVWVYWFWWNLILSLVQRTCVSNWRICFSGEWWNWGWKGLKHPLPLGREQLYLASSQEGNLLLKVPHSGCAAGIFWWCSSVFNHFC